MGGLKASMGYCGAKDLKIYHSKAEFVQITAAGMKENHHHEVRIVKEAPNYQISEG